METPANDNVNSQGPVLSVMLGIDYDEFKPETYRGCFALVFRGEKEERVTFPLWDAAETFANSFGCKVNHLSSVDNYYADLKSHGLA